jgi:hypothetical protein
MLWTFTSNGRRSRLPHYLDVEPPTVDLDGRPGVAHMWNRAILLKIPTAAIAATVGVKICKFFGFVWRKQPSYPILLKFVLRFGTRHQKTCYFLKNLMRNEKSPKNSQRTEIQLKTKPLLVRDETRDQKSYRVHSVTFGRRVSQRNAGNFKTTFKPTKFQARNQF